MEDEIFMEKALMLARRGLGKTSPNPMVGALVVKEGKILGKGYHRRYGGPHAEVIALRNTKGDVKGASMYVTLEPCCHHGWTPPCVDTLIEAGMGRVVIGTRDPNPMVNGKGIRILRENGIQVKLGVLEERCRELNEAYLKHTQRGSPLVTLKFAQSLDGRIATKTGRSQWISSPEALSLGHRLRAIHDGVLVGIGTILVDDPSLTVRLAKGKNPRRIIVDGRLRIPLTSKVLSDEGVDKTIIVATEGANRRKAHGLKKLGAEVLWAARNQRGEVDMKDLLEKLGRMEITSVLVEGGAKIITSFLRERLADKIVIMMAPKLIGKGIEAVGNLEIRDVKEALRISKIKMRRLGEDIIIEGHLQKGKS
ncbi:MAG: bifunctional diaminohydroxyphosphoribosylaminopyrimidine deaminase/5-amino-6-(5-phosphoribosylamino)uracil reductase RibD [Syntrophobacterales bacterium]|nr:MAG: bifunctional diaminohydroxyphosphoribosylaminopyrimidine deaminase/5-amino-6-(5-phosphoribosylamino)uracil reductase RibD [Syntrophobacterales bacterium]